MKMDYYVQPWDDYSTHNMMVALIGLLILIFIIAYVWKCCKFDEDKPSTEVPPQQQQIPQVPCFAHEIEPGLVVLQSPDGEYFRILQEYDATKYPKHGAAPPAPSQPLQFIPQFTRPHYQTHAQPTAPLNEHTNLLDLGTSAYPPPYYTTQMNGH